jgi:hypothetical protein
MDISQMMSNRTGLRPDEGGSGDVLYGGIPAPHRWGKSSPSDNKSLLGFNRQRNPF